MSENNNNSSRDSDFTNLTFDEIKKRLVNRARTYYPDTYKDFNKTSFGSLMFDLVSLASEQLNFYAQFVANETLSTDTALQYSSLQAMGKRENKNINQSYTSTGVINLYSLIPADSILAVPNASYRHRILRGATFATPSGGKFTSTEDVVVDVNPEKIIGTTISNDGSRVTYYIQKSEVPVVSGEERAMSIEVGSYNKFLKLELRDSTISEVLKVTDTAGNEFFEVNNLTENVIYLDLPDRENFDSSAPSKLVPLPVPRRFISVDENSKKFIQFGFGSEDNLKVHPVADPAEIALQRTAKKYTTNVSFDPAKLLNTDKFGVAPQNTTLEITYRANNTENSNAPVNTITQVLSADIIFENETALDNSKTSYIRNNITSNNDQPINGALNFSTTQEVAQIIKSAKGSQSRAVTTKDYAASAYLMPEKFGSVKRVSVTRDENDLKRNLNMYVMSQDFQGNLQKPSTTLKNNLKTWLNSLRMISDTIDIFDAEIINLGLEFEVVLKSSTNTTSALSRIRRDLFNELTLSNPEIAQYFSVGEVERILNSMPEIGRVNSVKVVSKSGTGYSDIRYDISANLSPDGGLVYIPENSIWEIKNSADIIGKVK
jgi:hypothetical protein